MGSCATRAPCDVGQVPSAIAFCRRKAGCTTLIDDADFSRRETLSRGYGETLSLEDDDLVQNIRPSSGGRTPERARGLETDQRFKVETPSAFPDYRRCRRSCFKYDLLSTTTRQKSCPAQSASTFPVQLYPHFCVALAYLVSLSSFSMMSSRI